LDAQPLRQVDKAEIGWAQVHMGIGAVGPHLSLPCRIALQRTGVRTGVRSCNAKLKLTFPFVLLGLHGLNATDRGVVNP
jgi:hypothetical protein